MTKIDNYLKQISRVLKKNKRCLITFFLLNEINRDLIVKKASWLTFMHKINNCFVEDLSKKEFAVAYDENYMRSLFEENGLKIVNIEYGSWSGRGDYKSILKGKSSLAPNFTKLQDIVVAEKY